MFINYTNEQDWGRFGKATEENVKAFLHLKVCVAKAGQSDMRKNRVHYEIKTGAGELGDVGGKLVKGSSMVIYIPVVQEGLSVDAQEGFVMGREVFLATLGECGMIREKTSTAGKRKVTIQTFWIKSKNKPHGTKLATMMEAFYNLVDEGNAQTLEDWLAQF